VLQCSTVYKCNLLSYSSRYKNITFSCFSHRRPVFDARTICVRFIVEKVWRVTYNEHSGRLLATIFAVERQKVSQIPIAYWRLRYPACIAQTPYYHLWFVWLSDIFHIISWKAQFSKKVTEHKKRILIFPTLFVWNISHYKKKGASYGHKCILVLM
jgi:hypothetical protein